MACDAIKLKCQVKKSLLEPLRQLRRETGKLGALGGVKFRRARSFFTEETKVGAPQWNFPNGQVVIGCGDIHGDLLVLLTVLVMQNLISADTAKWVGGDKHVVFCGDLLDRSGRSNSRSTSSNQREEIDILQYLHGLREQAAEQGGAVVTVLGNHDFARVFHKKYANYEKYVGETNTNGWGGTKAMRKLFSPGGAVARYVAGHFPLVAVCKDFVFMHGGPVDDMGSVAQLNEDTFASLMGKKKPTETMEEMLWTREFSKPKKGQVEDELCETVIDDFLTDLGVNPEVGGLVIGHSIQRKLDSYCGGKVWRVDLGMSEAFGKGKQVGSIKISQGVTAVTLSSHRAERPCTSKTFIHGEPIRKHC